MTTTRVPGPLKVWIVALWLAMGPAWLIASATRGQEPLTSTYTSPNYGYSFSWSSPWLQMGESSNDLDVLRLTNGISRVVLIGGEAAHGDARLAAGLFADGISQLSGVSDFQIVDAGGNTTRYFITATMSLTIVQGIEQATTEYIEVRTLIPGRAIVLFDGYGPSELYERAKFEFDRLLETLILPTDSECDDAGGATPCVRRQQPPTSQAASLPGATDRTMQSGCRLYG